MVLHGDRTRSCPVRPCLPVHPTTKRRAGNRSDLELEFRVPEKVWSFGEGVQVFKQKLCLKQSRHSSTNYSKTKLLTRQFLPISGPLIYNALSATSLVLNLYCSLDS
ncbi:unnamed protein product [Calypogeia fissa]